MKAKEVAMAVRRDDNAIVHRLEEGIFWAGSTYRLVKMTREEYESFKARYNSYNNTTNIPYDIDVGQSIYIQDKEVKDGPNVKQVIQEPDSNNLHPVYKTQFKFIDEAKKRELRLYIVNDVISGYNTECDRIIDQFDLLQAVDHLNAIRCYDGLELKAIVMPINFYAVAISEEYDLLLKASLPERR